MNNPRDITSSSLPRLAQRSAASHKGDYGRALLIGGSRGMSGAITLAGRSTLRSGAGLVTLAVPAGVQDVVAGAEASYMTHALADDDGRIAVAAVDEIIELARSATVVAIGPGLGRSPALTALVAQLYKTIAQPMVVDADGLFALAEQREALSAPAGPRVVTPHAGEFARLAGFPVSEARDISAVSVETRVRLAADLANDQTVVVLKGHRTVIADRSSASVNQTGNPGLATGGSGDVLTGVITGLICQGLTPFDAARLGCHLHGLAGDLAADELGQVSLIASDLIDYLPRAFQSHAADC